MIKKCYSYLLTLLYYLLVAFLSFVKRSMNKKTEYLKDELENLPNKAITKEKIEKLKYYQKELIKKYSK